MKKKEYYPLRDGIPKNETDLPDRLIGMPVKDITCLAFNVDLIENDTENWRKLYQSRVTGVFWEQFYESDNRGGEIVIVARKK